MSTVLRGKEVRRLSSNMAVNIGQLRIEAVESGRQVIHRPAHLQSQRRSYFFGAKPAPVVLASSGLPNGSQPTSRYGRLPAARRSMVA
jgi:hypothetical protein